MKPFQTMETLIGTEKYKPTQVFNSMFYFIEHNSI